jgi:hypothetical protein
MLFVNENLPSAQHLPHFYTLKSITAIQGNLVHIPEKYYERIPQFYFIVGILLLANSFYLGIDDFASYFYMAFGFVSLLYAVGVKRARERNRNYPLAEEDSQTDADSAPDPTPESEARELS